MTKFYIFDTFKSCNDSEHYDHLYQKAVDLAAASGVDVEIIRNNNLHIQDEKGIFPLDQYILDNGIIVEDEAKYENQKNCWRLTTAWAIKYKFNNKFVYRKGESDRNYTVVDIEDLSQLQNINGNGNLWEA
jgi:hypothetical protein